MLLNILCKDIKSVYLILFPLLLVREGVWKTKN